MRDPAESEFLPKFSCPAKWEEMALANEGRYCDACNKVIHDFTRAEPDKIRETYQKSNGNLCGKFKTGQTVLPKFYQRMPRSFRIFLMALTLTFIVPGLTNTILGQVSPTTDSLSTTGTAALKGITYDEYKNPLPFVMVKLFRAGSLVGGAYSDIDGNYVIKGIYPGKYRVTFLYIGEEVFSQEIELRDQRTATLSPTIIEPEQHISVGIIVYPEHENFMNDFSGRTIKSREIDQTTGGNK